MRTLLRTVMYAVAVVAGVDAYLVGLSLAGQSGLPVAWAQVAALLLGAIVALIVATVPVAIYQRLMRRSAARRRAARFVTPQPVELALEPTPPPGRPHSNQTYGVTAREYRSLEWPAPQPVPNR